MKGLHTGPRMNRGASIVVFFNGKASNATHSFSQGLLGSQMHVLKTLDYDDYTDFQWPQTKMMLKPMVLREIREASPAVSSITQPTP